MLRIKKYWQEVLLLNEKNKLLERKQNLYKKRNVQILDIHLRAERYSSREDDVKETLDYYLHINFLLQQKEKIYIEESVQPLRVIFNKSNQTFKQYFIHYKLSKLNINSKSLVSFIKELPHRDQIAFTYNRREAVRYAELWWNSFNPRYKNFQANCANFVSQCLLAGDAPLWGAPERSKGWWYIGGEDKWSYSWSLAHSMKWYLTGSQLGLQAIEKEEANQLQPGDIICYDFTGNNHWDHVTIVTSKDAYGEPLVNAHTDFSRHRYWSYEDSLAWTKKCQYKFFHITHS